MRAGKQTGQVNQESGGSFRNDDHRHLRLWTARIVFFAALFTLFAFISPLLFPQQIISSDEIQWRLVGATAIAGVLAWWQWRRGRGHQLDLNDGLRLLDTAAGALLLLSQRGTILWGNAAAAALLGIEQERLRGRDMREIIHWNGSEYRVDEALSTAAAGTESSFTSSMIGSGGQIVRIETCFRPVLTAERMILLELRDRSQHDAAEIAVRDSLDRQAALNQVALALAHAPNEVAIYERVNLYLSLMLPLDTFAVYITATTDSDAAAAPFDAPVFGEPYSPALLAAVATVEADSILDRPALDSLAVETGAGSLMVLTLSANEQVFGYMLAGSGPDAAFTSRELNTGSAVAMLAGPALAAARRNANRDAVADQLREQHDAAQENVRQLVDTMHEKGKELARLHAAYEQFLTRMSHELRAPLNVMLGQADSLSQRTWGELTIKQHYAVQLISESGTNLLYLIDDMIDLARLDAGRVEMNFQVVDIENICSTSLHHVAQKAAAKQLTLTREIAVRQQTIEANEGCLQQVLVHLLNNAIKFTPRGGEVGLTVTEEREANLIRFEVWDSGIGIDPESMTLFGNPGEKAQESWDGSAPFFAAGDADLGLLLVSRLTALHQGELSIDNAAGGGSRFAVTLPRWQAIPEDSVEEAQLRAGLTRSTG